MTAVAPPVADTATEVQRPSRTLTPAEAAAALQGPELTRYEELAGTSLHRDFALVADFAKDHPLTHDGTGELPGWSAPGTGSSAQRTRSAPWSQDTYDWFCHFCRVFERRAR